MEPRFFEVENTRMSNAPGYTEDRLMADSRIRAWANARLIPRGEGSEWALLELTDALCIATGKRDIL